jgi:stage V sporulation protein R
MKEEDMKRLKEIDGRIQEIAVEYGLSVKPIDFEIVPAQRMFEIMAYGLPVNFRHWSRGRDYERLRTIYEHSGAGLPYEMVLNTDPPKAFLMETNPFPIQVLVMAHVYAHVDFFLNNQNFFQTPPDILVRAYEAAKRFDQYEQRYGLSELEPLVDAGLALQFNIDPDIHKKEESREEQLHRLYAREEEREQTSDEFHRLYPQPKEQRPDYRDLVHRTPLEPTRNVFDYIIENSPRPLQDWEKDVLEVIARQGRYIYPQIRTKITNEGWAAYWHEKIMRRLFKERHLTPEEHGVYARYHSAVLQPNPFQLNPYLVGKRIFKDVKERWDKGRFGKAWRECENEYDREHWDTGLGRGEEKIFGIRRMYSDRMLIEHFLTDELVHDLELYIYRERQGRDGKKYLVVVENRPQVIRDQLKNLHADGGQPRIMVWDGNYKDQGIYLYHRFEGTPLDHEYLKKTLEHIFFLWGRDVYLETSEVMIKKGGEITDRRVVHYYNGNSHKIIDHKRGVSYRD